MRLGYSYRISWGGSPIFFKFNPDLPVGASAFVTNTNPAPGAKLQLSGERYYAYVGFKTSLLLNRNPQVNEQVAVYGALAGAGVDIIAEHLRLEANGGYFDRGTNPLFFGTTVGPMGMTFTDFPVATYGGTVQLSAFKGLSPTQSADFKLYENDPMVTASRYFTRPAYPPGFNWMASAEFTAVGTTLQDVGAPQLDDDAARPTPATSTCARSSATCACAATSRRAASATSSSTSRRWCRTRTSRRARPSTRSSSASLGLDYFFERIGFTAGASVGIERPATFTPPSGQTIRARCRATPAAR